MFLFGILKIWYMLKMDINNQFLFTDGQRFFLGPSAGLLCRYSIDKYWSTCDTALLPTLQYSSIAHTGVSHIIGSNDQHCHGNNVILISLVSAVHAIDAVKLYSTSCHEEIEMSNTTNLNLQYSGKYYILNLQYSGKYCIVNLQYCFLNPSGTYLPSIL